MVHSNSNQPQNEVPRTLNSAEREVILAILLGEVPGAAELRAQLEGAQVVRHWPLVGSPSIDVVTSPEIQRSSINEAVFPVDANVTNKNGEYIGELILWLTDGRLSGLEYSWITDSMPQSLPPVQNIQFNRSLT